VVRKHYTPDKNQAIYRAVSACHFLAQTSLQSYKSVVGTSTNQVDNAYRLLIPHTGERFNCGNDLIGDQPMLWKYRLLTRKLVSDTRLHCDSDHLSQRVVLALGTMPTSLIPQLRHAKVETFLQTGTCLSDPNPLRVGEKSPLNRD